MVQTHRNRLGLWGQVNHVGLSGSTGMPRNVVTEIVEKPHSSEGDWRRDGNTFPWCPNFCNTPENIMETSLVESQAPKYGECSSFHWYKPSITYTHFSVSGLFYGFLYTTTLENLLDTRRASLVYTHNACIGLQCSRIVYCSWNKPHHL